MVEWYSKGASQYKSKPIIPINSTLYTVIVKKMLKLLQVEVLETGTTDPKKITKVTHIAFDDPAPRKWSVEDDSCEGDLWTRLLYILV